MFKFEPIFQVDEWINHKSTDRLDRIAILAQDECLKSRPLPPPFTILTPRTVFGVEGFAGKFKTVSEEATPIRWERSRFGRSHRTLVVEIKLVFTRNQSTFWNLRRRTVAQDSTDFKQAFYECPSLQDIVLPKEVNIPTLFRTDVELFPLTMQEAAFAGCRLSYRLTNPLIWGIQKDVEDLKMFPLVLHRE